MIQQAWPNSSSFGALSFRLLKAKSHTPASFRPYTAVFASALPPTLVRPKPCISQGMELDGIEATAAITKIAIRVMYEYVFLF